MEVGMDLVGHRGPALLIPLCFLGGADKNVIVFDKSSEQILATLKGHSKKVTSVVFHPSQVRSAPSSPPSQTAPDGLLWSLLCSAGGFYLMQATEIF